MLDKFYNIKIIDLGETKPLSGNDGFGTFRSLIGTQGYLAPEVFARKPYKGQSVDIFALGVIFFILYSGHPPFQTAKNSDLRYKLLSLGYVSKFWQSHLLDKKPGYFSDEFKDLIISMLQLDPESRPSAEEIFDHPWFTNEDIATPEEVHIELEKRYK